MNVPLAFDNKSVKEARKIAVERHTTLTELVRNYLQPLAAESTASGRRRRERDALKPSFSQFRFHVETRTWKREDLYARPVRLAGFLLK